MYITAVCSVLVHVASSTKLSTNHCGLNTFWIRFTSDKHTLANLLRLREQTNDLRAHCLPQPVYAVVTTIHTFSGSVCMHNVDIHCERYCRNSVRSSAVVLSYLVLA